jgi:erythritol transport system ATP-binding protein
MMPAGTEGDIVLKLEGVSKIYAGTVAVKHADFAVHRGAVNVLVGENGAGKSTLMKIIAGAEQSSEGRILIDGAPVILQNPADAARRGIAIVFQELSLFGNLSVAENIFAAREITRSGGRIAHREQERRATDILARLQADIAPGTLVEDLRIGQQQLVEIARAVAQDARILILDEPTSALSAAEVEILFRVLAELKAGGVAIVYVSHRLEELLRIGDHITVLRDGRVTGQDRMANVDLAWIIRKMIGSDAKDFAKRGDRELGAEIFRATDICLPRRSGGYAVDHVSLSARRGEIVGIYGLMGAGRSELLECILGRHRHATGRIFIDGVGVDGYDVADRIRSGIALIPEDRQQEGLVSILSVSHNLTMAALAKLRRGFHIRSDLERQAVRRSMRDLSIKARDPSIEVSSLSGGNQQKVVIGKALMTSPKVLLMDEPSRGIDVGAKADVFLTMRRLAAQGLAILFVTSDLDEVMALSDRIAVMSNGRLVAVRDRAEATETFVVAAAAQGHGPARAMPETGTAP